MKTTYTKLSNGDIEVTGKPKQLPEIELRYFKMPTPPITNIHNAINELYEASSYIAERELAPDKMAAIEQKLAELIAIATDTLNELKG